jgi:type III restriction enzyme
VPGAEKKPYLPDIDHGKLSVNQEQAVYAVNLDLVETEITETDLVRWLDNRLRTTGVTQAERAVWLGKVLRWLQREKQFTLTALVRHRNQLADALAERMQSLRGTAQCHGFQLALVGDNPKGCISSDYEFRFAPGQYPAQPPYYQGRYRFRKHYYGVIGDLKVPTTKQTDHEYFCAVAIDEHEAVRHWVRNLPRSDFSFRLPTAKDNFYPDFVAELMDGRLLVVEYKGEGYKTNDDSRDKKLVGEYWAKVTGNLFLMAVEKDEQGRDVTQQVAAVIGPWVKAVSFAEHQRVRLVRDVMAEGYQLRQDMGGTVVSVYGNGAAYAVEFADAGKGEFAVVTLDASTLVAEVLQ